MCLEVGLGGRVNLCTDRLLAGSADPVWVGGWGGERVCTRLRAMTASLTCGPNESTILTLQKLAETPAAMTWRYNVTPKPSVTIYVRFRVSASDATQHAVKCMLLTLKTVGLALKHFTLSFECKVLM